MPKSIHSGWVKARYIIESLRLKFWEKWWKNDSSQIDPGSFQQAYQSSRTSKHMLKHQMKWFLSFRKKLKILMKTYHSDDFLDLKFAFSPCWRMCCPAGASRGKPGDSQKTYSRTSKMVGYFELSVPLSEHFLHESEKWDFWSRTPLEHLQIDLNILLHI